ncbi:DUF6456 domain-containing protein [Govanella unica]|uniref:DUF6456 domain-containing protein n=1 Tax=Govanella unica TaxID=2975056 RepID=A0A9X3U0K0_9PROT|nr:DUF6456 domain-containing protein [Govania unica]MDA5194933.1 DUF6456 domain-containing protein [Govania unica]
MVKVVSEGLSGHAVEHMAGKRVALCRVGLGVSARAEKVMRALGAGGRLWFGEREGEAGWWLGEEDVTVAVATLLARDLVQRDPQGYARLSAPGAAWLRRRAASDVAGRALLAGDLEAARQVAPYRDQHRNMAETCGPDKARRWVNQGESALGWLRRRRDKDGAFLLSEAQFLAGERLRSDFERAGIPPRVTSVWSGLGAVIDGGVLGLSPSEAQMRSRARFHRAVEAMGSGLAEVVVRVACYQEGLTLVESGLGWPARSAKVVLGLGLDRLQAFYGIGEK